MSEENKWSAGAELNDAALEGVSGGDDISHQLWEHAMHICEHDCLVPMAGRCKDGNDIKLRDYMLEHGRIDSYRQCPFFQKR